ncbi:class A beta-lactamase-related serine hydrolase [bacterium]|nr:MAG: class A beta-lactamase-related serine hydrolase [bacterium]
MRKIALSLLAVSLVGGCGGSSDPSPSDLPFPASTVTKLDKAIQEAMASVDCPGAVVGLWIPGEGSYVVTKGVRDKVTKEPMRLDDHFRIGSNTKAFVGTVILQMVDEGLITLDQKVSTIIENVPNGDKISIRNLLNMTSGLVNYSELKVMENWLWYDHQSMLTTKNLLNFAFESEHPIEFQPGEEYSYSNTNTVLLGEIIRIKTGKSPAQAFQERIFARLGMAQTSWPTTNALPTPHPRGYTDDTPDKSVVDATDYSPSWTDAAGQLVSDLQDMKVWAKSMGTGSLISPKMQTERLKWVTAPGAPQYYGLAIGKSGGWLHHQGELPGFNTIACYLPQKDAVMVVLCTSNVPVGEPGPAARVCKAVSDVVTPQYSPGTTLPDDEN